MKLIRKILYGVGVTIVTTFLLSLLIMLAGPMVEKALAGDQFAVVCCIVLFGWVCLIVGSKGK